mgnify:FL=1
MSCTCSRAGSPEITKSNQETRPKIRTLKAVDEDPMIGETPPSALSSWLTPNPLFYIRNHFPFPSVDASESTWRITVDGEVGNPQELRFDDLLNLPRRTLAVTMECAGNNRRDLEPKVPGNQFDTGAVSTAVWTGTSLVDVLHTAGLKPESVEILFEGADSGEPEPGKEIQSYSRSLPIEIASHPDTIIAYEMNGEPLTVEHGAPVRLVVPGWYGMASVKWLQRIIVLTKPFKGYFQTYKYVVRYEDGNERPVREMRVKSFISTPRDKSILKGGAICLSGFAWSGRSDIDQVELSADGGDSWESADLLGPSTRYSWQQWNYRWNTSKRGHYTIISRARDTQGNVQPMRSVWNEMGYEVNGTMSLCLDVL